MSQPGEHKTVRTLILQYAQEISGFAPRAKVVCVE